MRLRLRRTARRADLPGGAGGWLSAGAALVGAALLSIPPRLIAQTPEGAEPIAIVPLDNKNLGSAAVVLGALEITDGKAIIGSSGTIVSGAQTTDVVLPRRGMLRVCASTSVKLAADTSVPASGTPGLLMGLDRGAIEASFATGRNSDVVLTPDFRILISGPGSADVKVRLGQHGDTCVDNAGVSAPYVVVSSVFDGGAYRVQAGQRVMFENGSLREVVDREKEPCGCPPPPQPGSNAFPLAQSEGLAPGAPPVTKGSPQASGSLAYNSADHAPAPADGAQTAGAGTVPATMPPKIKKRGGFFGRIWRFFRRVFGAE